MDSELFNQKIEEFSSVPILEVAELLELKTKPCGSNRYDIYCPAHNDLHMGSCKIDVNKNRWTCFACGAGGGPIQLVKETNHCTFIEACNWIAKNFGLVDMKNVKEDMTIKHFPVTKEQLLLLGLKPCVKEKVEGGQGKTYFLDKFFHEDEITCNYIIIFKLQETLEALISTYNMKLWKRSTDTSIIFCLKNDVEKAIDTLLPLEHYYEEVAPSYGADFSFVNSYKKDLTIGNPNKLVLSW